MNLVKNIFGFDENKKNVILDLDETIINATPTDDAVKKFEKQPEFKKTIDKFTWHDMDGTYIICERPHLSDFMDWLFKNFNVSVWTAASKDYALFIIKNSILCGKEDRKLQFIFFDYHCDLSQIVYKDQDEPQKKLELLYENGPFNLKGFNKNNTVLLDDKSYNKDCNGPNCIQVLPFRITDVDSDVENHLDSVKKKLELFKKEGPQN